MKPLAITAFTTASAAGIGNAATLEALRAGRTGLAPNALEWAPIPCWIGRVADADSIRVPAALSEYDCANTRLALLALEQDGFIAAVERAKRRFGAARIGIFLGTTTSGIRSTEDAYARRNPDGSLPADFRYATRHNMDATTEFVRRVLGADGAAITVSTACSSSAKVFCVAERYIRAGLIDAAVVGGADTLCLTTLYGFNALQLVSEDVCRPYDSERKGLSIGEAAGFALLERDAEAGLALHGYGETSDAHHMSTPHPEGEGALRAMRAALACARLETGDIGYVNLHGTASPANDLAEGRAVHDLFGTTVACSSTKGFTGHALGAAGIVEANIALLALRAGFVPGSPTTRNVDPETRLRVALAGEEKPLDFAMSNSFGFGGNNCALVFGKAA
jgi:3-oxoacyl-[acyl-carrier-protein] synthase I